MALKFNEEKLFRPWWGTSFCLESRAKIPCKLQNPPELANARKGYSVRRFYIQEKTMLPA